MLSNLTLYLGHSARVVHSAARIYEANAGPRIKKAVVGRAGWSMMSSSGGEEEGAGSLVSGTGHWTMRQGGKTRMA